MSVSLILEKIVALSDDCCVAREGLGQIDVGYDKKTKKTAYMKDGSDVP